MKQYSGSFNKRSRLLRVPGLAGASAGALKSLEPDTLVDHLGKVLQVQNDFFPCFDWAFPPPLLNKHKPPESAAELFSRPSVEPGKYSLYLHIPFCKTLCSFCYYTVMPGRGIEQSGLYIDYLIKEMELYAPVVQGQWCESVYIGGGTPSYLDDVFGDLIRALEEIGHLQRNGDELSLTGKAAYYNNIIPMLFAPDAFKEQLMTLPEEYLAEYPVPYVMTQAGCTQSAAMNVCAPDMELALA